MEGVVLVMLGEESRILLDWNAIVTVMPDVGESGTSNESIVLVASVVVLLELLLGRLGRPILSTM
jgi:hypothetical protein